VELKVAARRGNVRVGQFEAVPLVVSPCHVYRLREFLQMCISVTWLKDL
jgi:hypothetical protein